MHLREWLRAEATGLLDWLLPPACPLCATATAAAGDLCATCRDGIAPLPAATCPHCALPYPTLGGSEHACETCLHSPPPFLWTTAAGLYDGTLRTAIQRFKYEGALYLDRPLGGLLADALDARRRDYAPDLLLPVPLHPERLRQRTYNQALQLARRLGRRWRLPVAPLLLRRTRPTPPQAGLSAAERLANLRDAFSVQGPLAGARILLVDDVMTTGATARACSQALRDAGAAAVAVAVLARAARHMT